MKIVLIGPESSGKSTLGMALAAAINGCYVEEYARTYVEQLRRPYNYLDVLHIARKQYTQLQTDSTTQPSHYTVFDTDLIITKVWLNYKYGHCPEWINEALKPENNPVDLYLLCRPDLPFVPDPTREHPHEREELYEHYLQEVKQTKKPYVCISGTELKKRIEQATNGINRYRD